MLRTLFTALVLALVLFFQVTPALAACTTHTLWVNTHFVTCTTCCDYAGANCTTHCLTL